MPMIGKKIDSQLLDTQSITDPKIVRIRVYKNGIGFLLGFASVIGLLAAIAYGALLIYQEQFFMQERIDTLTIQLNTKLVPAMEEQLLEMANRIEELNKNYEKLKDNCTDIRYIIAPKFGKSVLTPIQRIQSTAIPESKIKLPKIKVPRNK
jgi:hypothetical protein